MEAMGSVLSRPPPALGFGIEGAAEEEDRRQAGGEKMLHVRGPVVPG